MDGLMRKRRRIPIVWLTISTGSRTVAASNRWTTNSPQVITIKSVRVAVV